MKDYLVSSEAYALYLKVNEFVVQLYHTDKEAFLAEAAFAFVVLLVLSTIVNSVIPWRAISKKLFRLPKWLRKGDTRMPKEREVSDAITNAVEQMVHEGVLTRRDAQNWYKKLGKHLQLPDVVPRDLKGLKKRLIDKRLRAGLPVPASVIAN